MHLEQLPSSKHDIKCIQDIYHILIMKCIKEKYQHHLNMLSNIIRERTRKVITSYNMRSIHPKDKV